MHRSRRDRLATLRVFLGSAVRGPSIYADKTDYHDQSAVVANVRWAADRRGGPRTGPSPMADDSLTDPTALATALPAPTTTLATLDAATLAPAEIAAALRFAAAAKAANGPR